MFLDNINNIYYRYNNISKIDKILINSIFFLIVSWIIVIWLLLIKLINLYN